VVIVAQRPIRTHLVFLACPRAAHAFSRPD
jgi:hypothetical protein